MMPCMMAFSDQLMPGGWAGIEGTNFGELRSRMGQELQQFDSALVRCRWFPVRPKANEGWRQWCRG